MEVLICKAIMTGAERVIDNRSLLNEINVFPVADGDTGNNLYSTMNSILLKETDSHTNIHSIADAAFEGAKGNSGTIFAAFLSGISEFYKNNSSISLESFIESISEGVKKAEQSVEKVVEGTMITAMREWCKGLTAISGTPDIKLVSSLDSLKRSVNDSKFKIEALRKNKVVDSGALGFQLFIEGFVDCILKKENTSNYSEYSQEIMYKKRRFVDNHTEVKERYCTELTIKNEKMDLILLKKEMECIGDSIVIVENNGSVKVHIHTDIPQKVSEIAASFGDIVRSKVDDIYLQKKMKDKGKGKVGLIVDSTADIPEDFRDFHGINIIPMSIIIGKSNYLDRTSISNQQILEYCKKEEEFPTFSVPNPKMVHGRIEEMLQYFKSVLIVTISSEMSATNRGIINIINDNRHWNGRVFAIDSKKNSAGHGLVVKKACEYINRGYSEERISELLNEYISQVEILVQLRSLDHVIKSGRVKRIYRKVFTYLSLKPIIGIDKDGRGKIIKKNFFESKSNSSLINMIRKINKKRKINKYAIVHVGAQNEAEVFADKIKRIIGLEAEYIMETSGVIAIGVGQGAIGIAIEIGKC